MSFTATDKARYAKLGISIATLEAVGVRRVTHYQAIQVCGLRYKSDHLEGIAYPYRDPASGQITAWRVRRDHPELGTDGKPIAKYVSSPDRKHFYVGPNSATLLTDVRVDAIFVEAESSVLALHDSAIRAEKRPRLLIGLGGCWGFRGVTGKGLDADGVRVDTKGALPDFDRIAWTGRNAIILFDANARTNASVQAARNSLALHLKLLGADPFITDLPMFEGNGPDDFIAAHGDDSLWSLVHGARRWSEKHAKREAKRQAQASVSREEQPVVVPPSTAPMAVAREMVKVLYTTADGTVLRSHGGDFFRWNGTCWWELDTRDVRAAAYQWLEHAAIRAQDGDLGGEYVPFEPTRRKIDDVIDALHAVVLVESAVDVPTWTDGGTDRVSAKHVISMQNGLLHIPTRKLFPHTPAFFTHHSLRFAYETGASAPPKWNQFLGALWPDDDPQNEKSSISVLQELFGYILGGGTSLQKIFLFVGPKRAGKGTIGRVLTGLLGAHHVAAPTFASLGTNFGLQPLVGKPLALISDARLSNKADDSKIVVERLLSVSGEDPQTIDRKYRDPWTGRLPTRFVILTNELPRFSDSSGALASRFVVFVLTRSFYGLENPGLTDELLSEAPSIFSWALEGLDRLNQRGYFQMPASGADAIQQLEDLSSPIGAFLREEVIIGNHAVEVDALWTEWKNWCERDNRHPGTKAIFGRDLRAAVPTIKRVRPRLDGADGERPYVYSGLGLRKTVVLGPPGPPYRDETPRPSCPRTAPMYSDPDVTDGRF